MTTGSGRTYVSRAALALAVAAGALAVPAVLGLGLGAAHADTTGLVWPADGVVTQNAAEHLANEGARAIDIAKSGSGLPIVAAAAGIVVTASVGGNTECYHVDHTSNGLGNYVVIKHSDSSGTTYTTYGHLASESVSAGDAVSQSQQIGVMGYTGCVNPDPSGHSCKCVAGQHVHFAVSTGPNEFNSSEWNDPDPSDGTAIARSTSIPNSNYPGTATSNPRNGP